MDAMLRSACKTSQLIYSRDQHKNENNGEDSDCRFLDYGKKKGKAIPVTGREGP
jgi:hypothetical protein